MLPDFPKAKKKLVDLFRKRWQRHVTGRGILSEIPQPTILQEGDKWHVVREDGTISDDALQKHSSEMNFTSEELEAITTEGLIRKWDEAAAEAHKCITGQFFSVIDKDCKEVDHVINGEGKPFSELFLEAQEMIEWTFGPDGTRSPGSCIAIHPKTFERIKPELEFMESDPEFNRCMKEIEDRKREEWRAREANRKLVD
jgi:hypothetical protein